MKAKLKERITELEVEMASLTSQLEVEHRQAKNASKGFYESEEHLNLENTNITLGREEVFYTVWRKYPDHDFSFLGEGVLRVIEGFKAKLTEEATPLAKVPDDEVR